MGVEFSGSSVKPIMDELALITDKLALLMPGKGLTHSVSAVRKSTAGTVTVRSVTNGAGWFKVTFAHNGQNSNLRYGRLAVTVDGVNILPSITLFNLQAGHCAGGSAGLMGWIRYNNSYTVSISNEDNPSAVTCIVQEAAE